MRDVLLNENEVLRNKVASLTNDLNDLRNKCCVFHKILAFFCIHGLLWAFRRTIKNLDMRWLKVAGALAAVFLVVILVARGFGEFSHRRAKEDAENDAREILDVEKKISSFLPSIMGSDHFVKTCFNTTIEGFWIRRFVTRKCSLFNTSEHYTLKIACDVNGCLIEGQ